MGYNLKLTDERADNLAASLGLSDEKLVNWVRGTSKSNHDSPDDVRIIDATIDSSGFGIETDWYYIDFDVSYVDDDVGYQYELDWIEEKVWSIQIYSSTRDESEDDMMPMDEHVLEAAKEMADMMLDDFVDMYGAQ